jgi:hypothetical protein
MLDTEAADLTRRHIARDYGSLADLPEALADTIANIYYHFYTDYARRGSEPHALPQSIRDGSDLFADMTSYVKSASVTLAIMKGGPQMIEVLRRLCDEKQDHLFQSTVEVTLDQWKFGIKNAVNKTGIRRMFERWLKRRQVQEIAGLAATLGLRNEQQG